MSFMHLLIVVESSMGWGYGYYLFQGSVPLCERLEILQKTSVGRTAYS